MEKIYGRLSTCWTCPRTLETHTYLVWLLLLPRDYISSGATCTTSCSWAAFFFDGGPDCLPRTLIVCLLFVNVSTYMRFSRAVGGSGTGNTPIFKSTQWVRWLTLDEGVLIVPNWLKVITLPTASLRSGVHCCEGGDWLGFPRSNIRPGSRLSYITKNTIVCGYTPFFHSHWTMSIFL